MIHIVVYYMCPKISNDKRCDCLVFVFRFELNFPFAQNQLKRMLNIESKNLPCSLEVETVFVFWWRFESKESVFNKNYYNETNKTYQIFGIIIIWGFSIAADPNETWAGANVSAADFNGTKSVFFFGSKLYKQKQYDNIFCCCSFRNKDFGRLNKREALNIGVFLICVCVRGTCMPNNYGMSWWFSVDFVRMTTSIIRFLICITFGTVHRRTYKHNETNT